MISYKRLATEIYEILAAPSYGYVLKLYDENGDSTTTPKKVRWIYVEPVDISVRLPQQGASSREGQDEVFLWKNREVDSDRILELTKRIRKICNLYGVGLTVKDFMRSEMKKRFADMTNREKEEDAMEESVISDADLLESMTGNAKRSYFTLENARMVVIHEKMIDEEKHGARSRNIKEVYVESGGERFKLPENYLAAGRALCRHLSEGGSVLDKTGRKIMESCREVYSLRSVVREYKKSLKPALQEMARSRAKSIRESLLRLSTPTGYHAIRESFCKTERIGKDKIQETKNRLAAGVGLNESEDLHEGFDFLAKLQVQESRKKSKKLYEVFSEISGLMEGYEKDELKEAARQIAEADIRTSMASEKIQTFSETCCGCSVRKSLKSPEMRVSFREMAESLQNKFLESFCSRVLEKAESSEKIKKYEAKIMEMVLEAVCDRAPEKTMEDESLELVENFVNQIAIEPFGLDEARSGLDKIKDFDKLRAGLGKKPIFDINKKKKPEDKKPETKEVDESNYPDDFQDPYADEISQSSQDRMQEELDEAIYDAINWYMSPKVMQSYGYNPADEEDFDVVAEIVTDRVHINLDEEARDFFWDEIEEQVKNRLRAEIE